MPNNVVQENPTRRSFTRRRVRVLLLAFSTILLFALLFAQQAFNTLEFLVPSSASDTLILYALSTVNFIAFIVLLMVLVRNLIKLRREHRDGRLGARFKTRLVVFFIAVSLLPILFLFFAVYGLFNRSVDKWFSLPASEMVKNAREIQTAYVAGEQEDLRRTVLTMARLASRTAAESRASMLSAEVETQGLLRAELRGADGTTAAESLSRAPAEEIKEFAAIWERARAAAARGEIFAEQVNLDLKPVEIIAAAPVEGGGVLLVARRVPPDLAERAGAINRQDREYERLRDNQRLYKQNALLTLALITLLALFISTWMALNVARTIAVPVQQLVQATERVKSGDLSYQTDITGDDELAALAISFNEMTRELAENRGRLEASTAELQSSNAALDERRSYIEAVLESLSAGVVSLDERGRVTTINGAARLLLRIEGQPAEGVELEALLPEEQREELRRMIRRAARLRSVTREVHFTLANQVKLDAAVTVAALADASGVPHGAVIVIEDLTELIEAQRRAAWSEVARRMAHEIKNPLTPIRLSAERLAKNLLGGFDNGEGKSANTGIDGRQARLVRECTQMIGDEVATLQRMVDEFSNFARLPGARLESADINDIIEAALKLYDERLDGINIETRITPTLPAVLADAEQIKRALVNLIDNAAEALAGVPPPRTIVVESRPSPEDGVEIIVSDNGPGIAPEDRARVFEPYFSTRKRGTGLGLAIVSRIVAEHQGRIRVAEGRGARFIIELPGADERKENTEER
ncbi:MAG: PAS domain-containing protein [Acidobacteria bacterium]|nr:PAS domain-containing protein [Acidobacteriota bacterium]MCW5971599.1 PAS domain-containing protein [Blastocatellales bacterium]